METDLAFGLAIEAASWEAFEVGSGGCLLGFDLLRRFFEDLPISD